MTVLDGTSIRVEWEDLPFDFLFLVETYSVLVLRAGTQELVTQNSEELFQFARESTITGLSPGVSYDVVLRGLYQDGVLGLNTTETVTTTETGEMYSTNE